jgi:hypothetical protein
VDTKTHAKHRVAIGAGTVELLRASSDWPDSWE